MFKDSNTSKMIQTLNDYFLSDRTWLQTESWEKMAKLHAYDTNGYFKLSV